MVNETDATPTRPCLILLGEEAYGEGHSVAGGPVLQPPRAAASKLRPAGCSA